MVSLRMQSYAAEIYRLQGDYLDVPLSALAEDMAVSLQAASRMIGRLKQAGLVVHKPYYGVRLTLEGEALALPAIRRHRLAEVFLVRVMGFGWEEVHDLTDQLELGINQTLEERIDELAGYPSRCPHGEPIPTRGGRMPTLNDKPLTNLEPGQDACISRVQTHDPDKLRYLGEAGLKPGVDIRLLSRGPFNGPLRISTRLQEHVLGHELASMIRVEAQN